MLINKHMASLFYEDNCSLITACPFLFILFSKEEEERQRALPQNRSGSYHRTTACWDCKSFLRFELKLALNFLLSFNQGKKL